MRQEKIVETLHGGDVRIDFRLPDSLIRVIEVHLEQPGPGAAAYICLGPRPFADQALRKDYWDFSQGASKLFAVGPGHSLYIGGGSPSVPEEPPHPVRFRAELIDVQEAPPAKCSCKCPDPGGGGTDPPEGSSLAAGTVSAGASDKIFMNSGKHTVVVALLVDQNCKVDKINIEKNVLSTIEVDKGNALEINGGNVAVRWAIVQLLDKT